MKYELTNNYHIAVPTAFKTDEELNCEATIEHIKYLQNLNIKSVMVCGTTGEQHSMDTKEKLRLLESINADLDVDKDFEVLFGVASTRQKDGLALAKQINNSPKISGILLGFPPYILPSQKEALSYVEAIAEAVDKPVVIYNNPPRTGFNISIPSLIKLFSQPNIIGVKEAGDATRIPELIEQSPKQLSIYAGGEINLENKINLGFNRLSSILGNLYPQETKSWFEALVSDSSADFKDYNELSQIGNTNLLAYIKNEISKKENIAMGHPRSPLGN